jgi:hypothetical protein
MWWAVSNRKRGLGVASNPVPGWSRSSDELATALGAARFLSEAVAACLERLAAGWGSQLPVGLASVLGQVGRSPWIAVIGFG